MPKSKINQDLNKNKKKVNINFNNLINKNFKILNFLFSRYETFEVKKVKNLNLGSINY